MNIQSEIRGDLWKAIELHFSKGDYTEALRDSMFFVNDLIRDKGGLADKDGTALMESSFLGKNPALKVTKCETQTEKDMQEGTGYALKGLCLSVRNPLSHTKINIDKKDAIAIILYINYLMNIVDKSKGKNKIDDWMDFLLDENFVNTKLYANELIKEIPNRKRFDLLLQIFRNREGFGKNKINYFVDALISTLTEKEHHDFIEVVNNNMLRCKDDNELKMFLHIFAKDIYSDIEKLCKLRIEEIIKQSILKGEYGIFDMNSNSYNYEPEPECNGYGKLATFVPYALFEKFETAEDISAVLQRKLYNEGYGAAFIMKYFDNIIFSSTTKITYYGEKAIKKLLNTGDVEVINKLEWIMDLEDNDIWNEKFRLEYDAAKIKLQEKSLEIK